MRDFSWHIMADKGHKWGIDMIHYTKPVYEYYYDSVCEIAIKDYPSHKQQIINKIKMDYYMALSRTGTLAREISPGTLRCCNINDIYDYFDYPEKEKNCLVLMALKDTAGSFFNEKLENKFRALGLTSSLIKNGWWDISR